MPRRHIHPRPASALLGAALALFAASASTAGLFAYEGFDYDNGAPLHLTTGGSGWSIPWQATVGTNAITAPGLTHPNAHPSTGNALSTNGSVALRYFASDIDPGATEFWTSVIMRRDASTSGGAFRFVGPTGAETTFAAVVGFGTANAPVFLAEVFGGNIGATSTAAETIPAGSTDLYVMHVVPMGATYRVDLIINPALGDTAVDASLTIANTTPLRGIVLTGVQGPTAFGFDEIRFGDSFDDVAYIPAPSITAMLAAALPLAARRRRR